MADNLWPLVDDLVPMVNDLGPMADDLGPMVNDLGPMAARRTGWPVGRACNLNVRARNMKVVRRTGNLTA